MSSGSISSTLKKYFSFFALSSVCSFILSHVLFADAVGIILILFPLVVIVSREADTFWTFFPSSMSVTLQLYTKIFSFSISDGDWHLAVCFTFSSKNLNLLLE